MVVLVKQQVLAFRVVGFGGDGFDLETTSLFFSLRTVWLFGIFPVPSQEGNP